MNKKRVAIIGMSGDSLFYDISGNNKKLVHREVGGKGYNQAIDLGEQISKILNVNYDEMYKHVTKKTAIERVHPEGRNLDYNVSEMTNYQKVKDEISRNQKGYSQYSH